MALSSVISDIYDAALDPSLWINALESACRFVGADKANLFWQDRSADVATVHQFNNDPHYSRLYAEVYAALNPVFPLAIAQDVGSVYAATDLVPVEELKESRFFKEWVAPQGIGDSIGVLLEKDAYGAAFVAFEVIAPLADAEMKRRTALLVPHFQRAVEIGRLFVKREADNRALTQTLDHVEAGVFLLSRNGRIVFANHAGQRLLEQGTVVRARSGAIAATSRAADRDLKRSLSVIETGNASSSPQNGFLLLSDDGHARWLATVLPLGDGQRRHASEAYEAIAAVFVRTSSMASPVPLEALAKHYGLTSGEIRVVEAILKITGLEAIAEALGVSRSTVKTHLDHILRKCGINSQRDLIKLFAGLKG